MATLPLTSSKLQSLTFKNSSLQNPTMIFFITGFIFSVCFTILLIILKKTCPKKDDQEVKVQSLVEKSDQNEKFENTNLSDDDVDGEREAKKKSKRKKRGKKKKKEEEDKEEEVKSLKDKELISLYPFTSTGSATQRKIKQQYDHLVKCNSSKGLTIAQVGEFANCLVEARNELRHKSEYIQRKFTITKALLFKADRSSFDRLRQQIYKLEVEQKRLEEDAFVYNWLQEHLKLSPAYKKMIEISESMELKAKSKELAESIDDEFSDISFEELLVQEKKDSFWQKHGKAKQWSR